MNISDRIQQLRKTKGISQEELADHIGVSRQAVSKWESEQSAPDIDKIILLSDFFGVTTDYLLKGIESVSKKSSAKNDLNPSVFAITATALNLIGLIASITIERIGGSNIATGIGMIIIVSGCMIFSIGMTISEPKSREKVIRVFSMVNVWIVSFIPLSVIYNRIVLGTPFYIPVPRYGYYWYERALFWAVYISIGLGVCLAVSVFHKIKKR